MSGEQGKSRTRSGSREAGRETAARVPEKVIGAKYVRLLEMHLRAMREDTAHGNRRLFLDDVFVAYTCSRLPLGERTGVQKDRGST